MLNLPLSVNKKLESAQNILIVGAGGGQDVLCGLPLYYTFLKQGKKVHLANLTHTDFKTLGEHSEPIVLNNTVLGATGIIKMPSTSFVEGYLAQYFKVALGEDKVVWMINRTHVKELKTAFERLVDYLKIDAIILVDGGIDSVMRGDEGRNNLTKKFVDTTLMLSTIEQLESLKENVLLMSFSRSLEKNDVVNNNISVVYSQGGFYGGGYLLNHMKSYKLMREAYLYLQNNGNISVEIEQIIKITESNFDELEKKVPPIQFFLFNPLALSYNNIVIHKLIELNSYYDIVQEIAPFINKNIL